MNKTKRLRQLFERSEFFVLPGVASAFEAKMVEAIGYKACYMSGSGTAANIAGLPDAGLTTMTEIVGNARNIAAALSIPLVSDADTGYGNALNVYRTIQEFIRAGVAGVHIEDQVSPKRCGFIAGKQLVSTEEAVSKYQAAVAAGEELDKDFIVIARTDARTAVGGSLEEAIRRARAYREAGAHVAYVEGVQNREEMKRCVEEIGKPIMTNTLGIPPAEHPSHEEMEEMGIACAFHPTVGRHAITYRILWEYLHDVKARGFLAIKEWDELLERFPWKYPAPPHRYDLLGFDRLRQLEEKYLPAEELKKYEGCWGLYTPGKGGGKHF